MEGGMEPVSSADGSGDDSTPNSDREDHPAFPGTPSADEHEQIAVSALQQLHDTGGTAAVRNRRDYSPVVSDTGTAPLSSDTDVGTVEEQARGSPPKDPPPLRWKEQRPRSYTYNLNPYYRSACAAARQPRQTEILRRSRPVLPTEAAEAVGEPLEASEVEEDSQWQPRAARKPETRRNPKPAAAAVHVQQQRRPAHQSRAPPPQAAAGGRRQAATLPQAFANVTNFNEGHHFLPSVPSVDVSETTLPPVALNLPDALIPRPRSLKASAAPKAEFRIQKVPQGAAADRLLAIPPVAKPPPSTRNETGRDRKETPEERERRKRQIIALRKHQRQMMMRQQQMQLRLNQGLVQTQQQRQFQQSQFQLTQITKLQQLQQQRQQLAVRQPQLQREQRLLQHHQETILLPNEETEVWKEIGKVIKAVQRYNAAHWKFWNYGCGAGADRLAALRTYPLPAARTAAMNFNRLLLQEVGSLEDIIRSNQPQVRPSKNKGAAVGGGEAAAAAGGRSGAGGGGGVGAQPALGSSQSRQQQQLLLLPAGGGAGGGARGGVLRQQPHVKVPAPAAAHRAAGVARAAGQMGVRVRPADENEAQRQLPRRRQPQQLQLKHQLQLQQQLQQQQKQKRKVVVVGTMSAISAAGQQQQQQQQQQDRARRNQTSAPEAWQQQQQQQLLQQRRRQQQRQQQEAMSRAGEEGFPQCIEQQQRRRQQQPLSSASRPEAAAAAAAAAAAQLNKQKQDLTNAAAAAMAAQKRPEPYPPNRRGLRAAPRRPRYAPQASAATTVLDATSHEAPQLYQQQQQQQGAPRPSTQDGVAAGQPVYQLQYQPLDMQLLQQQLAQKHPQLQILFEPTPPEELYRNQPEQLQQYRQQQLLQQIQQQQIQQQHHLGLHQWNSHQVSGTRYLSLAERQQHKRRQLQQQQQRRQQQLQQQQRIQQLEAAAAALPPRQPPEKKTKSSKDDVIFSEAELTSLFHIKIDDAARILGVCTTVVKRQCRLHGIDRWPARKLQAILAQISAHEKQPDTKELVAKWRRMGGPWAGISEEEETRVSRLFQLVHEKHQITRSRVPDEYVLPGSRSRRPIDPALRAAGHAYALAVEDD